MTPTYNKTIENVKFLLGIMKMASGNEGRIPFALDVYHYLTKGGNPDKFIRKGQESVYDGNIADVYLNEGQFALENYTNLMLSDFKLLFVKPLKQELFVLFNASTDKEVLAAQIKEDFSFTGKWDFLIDKPVHEVPFIIVWKKLKDAYSKRYIEFNTAQTVEAGDYSRDFLLEYMDLCYSIVSLLQELIQELSIQYQVIITPIVSTIDNDVKIDIKGSKMPNVEKWTNTYAIFHFYLFFAGIEKNITKDNAVTFAIKYNVSPQNLLTKYQKYCQPGERNSLTDSKRTDSIRLKVLRGVIEMLEQFPTAQELAQNDFNKLEKLYLDNY